MEDKIVLIIIMAFPIILLLILGFVFINGKGSSLTQDTIQCHQKKRKRTILLLFASL